MKISLNWLQDFIKLRPKLSPEEIAWRLTEATAEVERIHYRGQNLNDVVVGEVLSIQKHPDADKLFLAKVKVSSTKTIQVVFGQKASVQVGDKVPTALAPTMLHGGEVKLGNIRGQLSEGMLCLESELMEGLPEALTCFSKEVPVGKKITEILPLKDVVFEIDNHSITHRADLFSHYGFCRELVALGLANWKKQYPNYSVKKLSGAKKLPFKVSCEDPSIFSRYHGTIVENLDGRQSPPVIKYRLHACGMRSLNAIVDITNYVMLETGAPMHAFDTQSIHGKNFVFRLSNEGEVMRTLDGRNQKLMKDIMVVENNGKIVDLVGIMGGENSAVSSTTKNIYFHQGIYNPVLIRKAMIKLGHRTDAGTIFEKSLYPELSVIGQCRTLELVKEIFPAASFNYQMVMLQNESKKQLPVKLTAEKLERHTGLKLKLQETKKILENLGCKVKTDQKSITVMPPAWRSGSIVIEEDIIEEITRIQGYSSVSSKLPSIRMEQNLLSEEKKISRELKEILVGCGYHEELNFAFLSQELLQKMRYKTPELLLEIRNPVSDDFRFMRPSQLPYLLLNLSRNIRINQQRWKSFEIGKVYERKGQEVVEKRMLTSMVWSPNEEPDGIRALKGVLKSLEKCTERKIQGEEDEHSHAYPGRSLSLKGEDVQCGWLYQLHPEIADNFDISQNIAVLEIDLEKLIMLKPTERKYEPIRRYPAVQLDVSVLVDETVKAGDISGVMNEVSPEVLIATELKEVYMGKPIEAGKKSFTFTLTYQSSKKTLEEEEIQDILRSLIQKIEKTGATVRR